MYAALDALRVVRDDLDRETLDPIRALQLLHERVRRAGGRVVRDGDARARLGVRARYGRADASRAAGDERGAALEREEGEDGVRECRRRAGQGRGGHEVNRGPDGRVASSDAREEVVCGKPIVEAVV
jgi:hypothetical protein